MTRLRWFRLAAVLAALSAFASPAPGRAQGLAAWDFEHVSSPYDTMNKLGGAAIQGGVGKPNGFRESTSPVVGMPPPQIDPAIEYANGLTDLEFGCYMQAREEFRNVLSVTPKDVRALFLIGVAYNSTGDRAAAKGAYEKALKIAPQMIEAERELAVTQVLLSHPDEARAHLAGLKVRLDNCMEVCADAALLKTSVARVEAALAGQLAESMVPAPPAVCSALTTTAARNCFAAAKFGDPHGDGLQACSTALGSTLPDEVKVRVLINRGVIRLVRSQPRQSLDDFDKAIAMNGEIGDAYTNRGAAQLALRQFELARADIDKGLAIGSSEPQRVYYNRGMADMSLGDNKAAYLDFLKAAKLDPNWPAPKAQLARFAVEDRGPE